VHSGANVLVLDEPTNHLDLESREALEAALGAFPGSLLLVSHDRALLDAVGTRTVAVEDGTLRSYLGGWAEYVRVREERAATGAAATNGSARSPRAAKGAGTKPAGTPRAAKRPAGTKPAGTPRAAKQTAGTPRGAKQPAGTPRAAEGAATKPARAGGPSKNARRRAERLEADIEAAEARLAAVEDELADPAAWQGADAAARSTARHEAARREVADLYAAWEAATG
jgi:ATP-binding cassette subfamily F protein 3